MVKFTLNISTQWAWKARIECRIFDLLILRYIHLWKSFRRPQCCYLACWLTDCLSNQLHGAELSSSQLVKFPAFYGTRRFITAFTSARHLSLSWARSIQSMAPFHFLKIHLNIILPSTPGYCKWPLSLKFPHHNSVYNSPVHHTCYAPSPSYSSRFAHSNNVWWGVQIMKLHVM